MIQKELTLLQRVVLPTIFPATGDYKTLKIREDLRVKCQLSQSEMKDFEITIEPSGVMSWNQAGVEARFPMEFTEFEHLEITATLRSKDSKKELSQDTFSLYELFCLKQ